jgi:hypothetical protein
MTAPLSRGNLVDRACRGESFVSCSKGIALERASSRDAFDVAATLLLILLAVLVVLTFRQYSISNDEGVQQRYGELIVAYYASGFADRTLFGFGNLYLYGGLFDIAATLLAKVVPLELYELRHLLCAGADRASVRASRPRRAALGGGVLRQRQQPASSQQALARRVLVPEGLARTRMHAFREKVRLSLFAAL